MRPLEVLYPDILPFTEAGKPSPLIDRQIVRSLQDFCVRTRAWQVKLDATTTAAGQLDYDIELPGGTELVRIENVWLDGESLRRGGRPIDTTWKGLRTLDGRVAAFDADPGAGHTLELEVSLSPANTARGIEDVLADRYAEVLAWGALGRLNADAGRMQLFIAGCDDIARRHSMGLQRRALRTVPAGV